MLTSDDDSAAVLDKRELQALGVLLPVRLSGLSFFSGRHSLGRAGEGMRFLRTRPFESGQDNPRDIDKFSPPGELRINEWEAEAQATVLVFADVSASMKVAPKAALLNLALLQLTYSLWRAGDRVGTTLFSAVSNETIARRNLKAQLEHLLTRLASDDISPGRDPVEILAAHADRKRATREDLIFMLSDFCGATDGSEAGNEESWRVLQRTMSCDVVPVVISFVLAADQRGSIRLWDAERNRHGMTLITPSRVRRINAAEAARVRRLQTGFRRLGMDCLVLRRERDVYPELAKLARWRRRHRH